MLLHSWPRFDSGVQQLVRKLQFERDSQPSVLASYNHQKKKSLVKQTQTQSRVTQNANIKIYLDYLSAEQDAFVLRVQSLNVSPVTENIEQIAEALAGRSGKLQELKLNCFELSEAKNNLKSYSLKPLDIATFRVSFARKAVTG